MKFDVQIKNLGKIHEANIKVRPLTLIAGINSSGKSFFTKSFYSILKTFNENYIGDKIKFQLRMLISHLRTLETEFSNLSDQDYEDIATINKYITLLYNEIGNLLKIINFNSKNSEILIEQSYFVQYLNKCDNLIKKFVLKLKNIVTKYEEQITINEIQDVAQYISDIIKDAKRYYLEQINIRIIEELQENFQVRSLHNLISKNSDEIYLVIKDVATLTIFKNGYTFQLKDNYFNIKDMTTVMFFEAPILWRLKDAFEILRNFERSRGELLYLTGIPKYFYDVADLLKLTPKADVEFPDLLEKIAKAINGQIVVSPTGSLVYKDDKYEYSLNTTALGISNLGMIGLLIEKNIVTKGSFLIIDEPETNLHPEWQMVLMEVLFELSKRGVNIVFATHSLDMVKCLEVIVQKAISQKEDLTDHIGINLLNDEGKSEELENDLLQQICEVKQTLAEPYALKSMESLKYD